MVATAGVLLLHTPPGVVLVSVVASPTHTDTGPAGVIATGVVFTTTVATAKQLPIE